MCAINPTHKKRFIIDVYTSAKITKDEFDKRITVAVLETELYLNESGKLRWHLKESKEEAE